MRNFPPFSRETPEHHRVSFENRRDLRCFLEGGRCQNANRRVAVFDSETGNYKRHWGVYTDDKRVNHVARTPARRRLQDNGGMKRFTDAIDKAITDKNWLAATALSLTMPDICGRMEHPKHRSEKRYKAWWDKYMLDRYRGGPNKKVFLSGADAYALRCAYVHEGAGKILHQRARQALTHFHFTAPNERHSIHNVRLSSQGNAALILQVDIFCRDMIDAVDRWSNDVASNQAVRERLQSLLEIHELPPRFRIGGDGRIERIE
jgi:hypothetical protein